MAWTWAWTWELAGQGGTWYGRMDGGSLNFWLVFVVSYPLVSNWNFVIKCYA